MIHGSVLKKTAPGILLHGKTARCDVSQNAFNSQSAPDGPRTTHNRSAYNTQTHTHKVAVVGSVYEIQAVL